ncbi:MAG: lactonase family protein [Synergistaceae bacterium]|jgi:6-phosphogluconolactonase|nr:lactonase family protein [Synergistaceae bacterium]
MRLSVFIGTYTRPILFGTGDILQGKGKGIYVYEMEPETGRLSLAAVTEGVPNPSYLTLSPSGEFLYCVNELKEYEGMASGSVSAFAHSEGRLRFLNSRATRGTDPCHISIDSKGTHVFAANFMSGSVHAFPVEKDGSLGEGGRFIQHEGKSVHPTRQKGPHAHSLVLDARERYALVPDLGLDRILIYKTDLRPGGEGLTAENHGFYESAPGSGPRHCVFHPSGRFCCVINELDVSVSVLGWSDGKGKLSHLQTLPLVDPETDRNGSIGADIQMSPDGSRVYASIRGLNTLSEMKAGPTGTLSLERSVPSGGKTPRSFALSPDGRFLVAANQDTDNLTVFRADTLDPVFETSVPTPVCVKIYRQL